MENVCPVYGKFLAINRNWQWYFKQRFFDISCFLQFTFFQTFHYLKFDNCEKACFNIYKNAYSAEVAGVLFFRLRLRSCSKIFESGPGSWFGKFSNLRNRLVFRFRLQSLIQP